MARSQQSNLKREKEKKKQKKRQEKEARWHERQNNSNKGKGLDRMVASADRNGESSDILSAGAVRHEEIQPGALTEKKAIISQGRVSYFNEQKGYGFIKDSLTKGTVFFHTASLPTQVKVNDTLFYTVVRGPKGATAENITKEPEVIL